MKIWVTTFYSSSLSSPSTNSSSGFHKSSIWYGFGKYWMPLRSGSVCFFGLITFGAVDPFLPFLPFFLPLPRVWLVGSPSPSPSSPAGWSSLFSTPFSSAGWICYASSGWGSWAAFSAASFSNLSYSSLSSSAFLASSAYLIFSCSRHSPYLFPTPIWLSSFAPHAITHPILDLAALWCSPPSISTT